MTSLFYFQNIFYIFNYSIYLTAQKQFEFILANKGPNRRPLNPWAVSKCLYNFFLQVHIPIFQIKLKST